MNYKKMEEDYCMVFHTRHSDETVMIPPAMHRQKKKKTIAKLFGKLVNLEIVTNIFLVVIKFIN